MTPPPEFIYALFFPVKYCSVGFGQEFILDYWNSFIVLILVSYIHPPLQLWNMCMCNMCDLCNCLSTEKRLPRAGLCGTILESFLHAGSADQQTSAQTHVEPVTHASQPNFSSQMSSSSPWANNGFYLAQIKIYFVAFPSSPVFLVPPPHPHPHKEKEQSLNVHDLLLRTWLWYLFFSQVYLTFCLLIHSGILLQISSSLHFFSLVFLFF